MNLAVVLLLWAGCKRAVSHQDAGRPPSPVAAPASAPPAPASTRVVKGDLPPDADAIIDDLAADDVRVVDVHRISAFVKRLGLERGGRHLRAKWKAMGAGSSEVQDGVDGNNAPRRERAAFAFNRLLFGPHDTRNYLVAPVVVRAFHRNVPCSRACAGVPRLPDEAGSAATLPAINDHLVLGTLTYWIDGVADVVNFEGDGGIWDAQRFATSPAYRRSFADLNLFIFLIHHGDANSYTNFLLRDGKLDRIYSIDNGISFDGPRFYLDTTPHDWDPFKEITVEKLVAPCYSPDTLSALRAIDQEQLRRALRVTAVIDLASGRSAREAGGADLLPARLLESSIEGAAGVKTLGNGRYLVDAAGRKILVLGISEAGIRDTWQRVASALGRIHACAADAAR